MDFFPFLVLFQIPFLPTTPINLHKHLLLGNEDVFLQTGQLLVGQALDAAVALFGGGGRVLR